MAKGRANGRGGGCGASKSLGAGGIPAAPSSPEQGMALAGAGGAGNGGRETTCHHDQGGGGPVMPPLIALATGGGGGSGSHPAVAGPDASACQHCHCLGRALADQHLLASSPQMNGIIDRFGTIGFSPVQWSGALMTTRTRTLIRVFSWVSPKKVPIADASEFAVALAVGDYEQWGRDGGEPPARAGGGG
jgi:hypothetical protein